MEVKGRGSDPRHSSFAAASDGRAARSGLPALSLGSKKTLAISRGEGRFVSKFNSISGWFVGKCVLWCFVVFCGCFVMCLRVFCGVLRVFCSISTKHTKHPKNIEKHWKTQKNHNMRSCIAGVFQEQKKSTVLHKTPFTKHLQYTAKHWQNTAKHCKTVTKRVL